MTIGRLLNTSGDFMKFRINLLLIALFFLLVGCAESSSDGNRGGSALTVERDGTTGGAALTEESDGSTGGASLTEEKDGTAGGSDLTDM